MNEPIRLFGRPQPPRLPHIIRKHIDEVARWQLRWWERCHLARVALDDLVQPEDAHLHRLFDDLGVLDLQLFAIEDATSWLDQNR